MHARALQQQRQVAFAAQQRLQPVQHAQGSLFAHAFTALHPLHGALQQLRQALARLLAQRQHARLAGQLFQATAQFRRHGVGVAQVQCMAVRCICRRRAGPRRRLAQQLVNFRRHTLSVGGERGQEISRFSEAQRARDPVQIFARRGQHMGLLIVQVLDAVLDLAEEDIGLGQRLGALARHQAGARQALQRVQCWARAQFGELAAAHHLQQLHDEFDFADATA